MPVWEGKKGGGELEPRENFSQVYCLDSNFCFFFPLSSSEGSEHVHIHGPVDVGELNWQYLVLQLPSVFRTLSGEKPNFV